MSQAGESGASPADRYVRSLRVNGHLWNSPWIPWSSLRDGGTIEFDLQGKLLNGEPIPHNRRLRLINGALHYVE